MKDPHPYRMCFKDWINFFVEYILSEDVGEEICASFLRHLIDLGLLIHINKEDFEWCKGGLEFECQSRVLVIKNDLESLCSSEQGFALPYFIGYKNIARIPLDTVRKKDTLNQNLVQSNISSQQKGIQPASNLSNLQIVNKLGKQLKPFLQVEEAIVSRLTGEWASKQDAKKMFHYMFGKMGDKAEPRVWEQLSRKRHR